VTKVGQPFRLEEVAEGVHAAIVTPGQGAMGNAAIVDLGERTILFDTFLTPAAARQLREAAIELTGRAPGLVVNSHRHVDHTLGNQEFVPDAMVISTTDTRERLRISPFFEQLPTFVAAIEARTDEERSEAARSALAADLADLRLLMAELPGVRRVLADVTFDDRLVLPGTRRRAVLLTHGGGTPQATHSCTCPTTVLR
jgi:cyclase